MKRVCVVAVVLLGSVGSSWAAGPAEFPRGCWGVYNWASWNPRTVNRQTSPHVVGVPLILSWRSVEPEEGRFLFHEQLDAKLAAAQENDYYVFLMLWVGPSSPRWIYRQGVPEVECSPTINPRGEARTATYPYYFDEDYRRYFHRLIHRFGRYVLDLPPQLRRRIVFIQTAEGSTGDGYGYKGDPLVAEYAISREAWGQFRVETWDVYREAFSQDGRLAIPLLVNDDSSRGPEHDWQMENLAAIGCKQGMFSHGYHISDTVERLDRWRTFVADAEAAGKQVFTRGEQDAEWRVCGWSAKNPLQGLYWSALFATHCGLDIWNVPSEACQGQTYAPALEFFNKYAGHRDSATAPAAFCALRRGLDASDTNTFPEDRFGKASKRNVDRYVRIAESAARWGAYQGDPPAATGGGMKNRQRKDYNDVGWGILPGNYCRFLQQIDSEATSTAWWHAGPPQHHTSRFARGFDQRAGKTAMFFRLDDAFFSDAPAETPVRLRVVYLDQGTGQWGLSYSSGGRKKTALRVECRNTGTWQEKVHEVRDAEFRQGLPRRSDLILEHLGGDDTIFHIIELDRL